jgi:hypothetical protein
MAKFDASEYERSDYENYLKLRGDTKDLLLHQSKCSAQYSESDKTIELFVDPFFAQYFNHETSHPRTTFPPMHAFCQNILHFSLFVL